MEEAKKTKTEKKLTISELKKIVLDLGRKGLTAEKIGLELKNNYNTSASQLKTKINKILKEGGIDKDPDITNLEKKIEQLKKHKSKNKHDYNTLVALSITSAKIRKLKKYRQKK